jgi:hypothetical protein
MLARLNFLLAVSASVVIAFYVVGRFVFLEVISRVAPTMVPYFVAAYALLALMLTVLLLAKTMIRLGSVSMVARNQRARTGTFLAQTVICLAHAFAFFGVYAFFTTANSGANWLPWVFAGALYLVGIVVAIADLRKRALSVSV